MREPIPRVHAETSIISLISADLRGLVAAEFTPATRWDILRRIYEFDPEIQAAVDMIAYMIHGMYAGPALSRLDADQPLEAAPRDQREFLERVDSLLDEIRFSQLLPTIIRLLLRDGNAIFRIHRDGIEISELELLPTSVVTIISRDQSEVIRSRDLYLINETPGGVAAETIPGEDILHFSLGAAGNLMQDRLGRWTYSIWGRSPLESLVFVVKKKAQTILDYFRWARVSMPRLEAVIDISEIGNPDNYTGTPEERVAKAQDAVRQVFREIEKSFYYEDTDPSSPTYRMKLPIEPDHIFVHSEDIKMSRLEGSSPFPDVIATIQDCNRSIATRLGIPLSALGYEEGATRAIGEVTRYYMHMSGNGLLRSLEVDLERFFSLEFPRRGWELDRSLVADFYIKTDFHDPDRVAVESELQRVRFDAAVKAFEAGLISRSEARKLMGLPEQSDEEPVGGPAEGQSATPCSLSELIPRR